MFLCFRANHSVRSGQHETQVAGAHVNGDTKLSILHVLIVFAQGLSNSRGNLQYPLYASY
jgi:hypothetical protein